MRRGLSRDATVAALLQEFIDFQSSRVEDRRTTHISTVLAYPRCLWPNEPRKSTKLTLRAAPRSVALASDLAYRIPGRARGPAHVDYTSRPLADALVTALAKHQHFVDEGLEGLPSTLTWAQANGLWRLVVGATLTETERRVYAQEDTTLVELLRDGEVVWHSLHRTRFALHLARVLFTGEEAQKNLRWVGEQRAEFEDWLVNVSDVHLRFGDHEFTEGAEPIGGSREGRAATMLWRARRVLALEDLARWLSEGGTGEITVTPPGWRLCLPSGWVIAALDPHKALLPATQKAVGAGAVLHIQHGSKQVLWPLTPARQPVPGVVEVVTGARQLPVTDLEIVEALLVTHGDAADVAADPFEENTFEGLEEPTHEPWYRPYVNADVAFAAGLIDEAERDRVREQARQLNAHRMRSVLDSLDRSSHDPADLATLEAAQHDPAAFARVARGMGERFRPIIATWLWDVSSITEVLSAPATPAQRSLRGREWVRHIRRDLDRDMHQAWMSAMWHLMPSHQDDF